MRRKQWKLRCRYLSHIGPEQDRSGSRTFSRPILMKRRRGRRGMILRGRSRAVSGVEAMEGEGFTGKLQVGGLQDGDQD